MTRDGGRPLEDRTAWAEGWDGPTCPSCDSPLSLRVYADETPVTVPAGLVCNIKDALELVVGEAPITARVAQLLDAVPAVCDEWDREAMDVDFWSWPEMVLRVSVGAADEMPGQSNRRPAARRAD